MDAELSLIVPSSQQSFGVPPLRRGACPSLAAPMQTGDGLLARLRPVGSRVTGMQMADLARLARRFGNGQLEVTARGNLQVRGLRTDTAHDFAEAVEALIEIAAGLPLDMSPLAGLDPTEIDDPRPLAAQIQAMAADQGLIERLGPKVSVVVDGGGLIGLRQLSADVRLIALGDGMWTLCVGDKPVRLVQAGDAADWILGLLAGIAELGEEARGRDLGPQTIMATTLPEHRSRGGVASAPGMVSVLADGRYAAHLGLPFGALDGARLEQVARLAGDFLLAPGHGLIALSGTADDAHDLLARAVALGLLTQATDARTAISACIGSAGCASGTLPARLLAEQIAAQEPDFFDGSFALHVSGCSKGCAHPRKALLTLVGHGEEASLVLHGWAGDAPIARFSQRDIPAGIERIARLWRSNRLGDESVAACFARLGHARIVAAVQG